MSASINDWCVVATFVLLSLADASAQNAMLAWDHQTDSTSTLGYRVSFDGLTTDYGISPFGSLFAGSCGCAVPLPFSGGHHTIVVTAYGPFGQIDSQALYVGPVAALREPYYAGLVGMAIDVDGAGSSSPNGWIVSYTWQWGDGTPDTISSSPTASHVFSGPGTFSVVLTVADNAGAAASATGVATITPPGAPPPPWTPPPPPWTPPSPWSGP
jgi:PKD domain